VRKEAERAVCGRLKGKNVLITGGSRGIGFAIGVQYAREGAAVALLSRSAEGTREAAARLESQVDGARTVAVCADVAEKAQAEAAVQQAVAALGRIDVLVNAAGVAGLGDIDVMAPEEWVRIVQVNLIGTYHVTRAVWPHMKGNGGGSIVMISSGSGRRAHAGWSAYCASKFGVMGLADALAKEGRPHGIRCNVICPGPTDTDQRRGNFPDEDRSRLLQPEDVAQAAVFFASDESRWVSGPGIDVRKEPV
jgi:NAD(P)-dependent dehydrogenase (short-subunit alcohol dehydrogenase family)